MRSLPSRRRLACSLAGTFAIALSSVICVSSPAAVADPDVTSTAPAQEPAVVPGPVPALSTATSDTVQNADGSLTATVYSAPVNYQDADGAWQPIDNTLVDAPGSTYAVENAAGPYTAELPEDPATTPVQFTVPSASDSGSSVWVTMQMHGATDQAPAVDGTTATLDDVSRTDGVTYEATGEGLKESIELDAPPPAGTQLSYTYSIDASDGLTPSIDRATGGIDFTAADGSVPVTVPAAVMYDSSSPEQVSTAVTYTLANAAGGWTLTVVPDMSWLESSSVTYPVTIDPSLSNQAPKRDCFIMQASPDSSHCGAPYVVVGGTTSTNRFRGLLDFDVSSIPTAAAVSSASAKLYLDSTQSYNGQTADYQLYELTQGFGAAATWNNATQTTAWGNPGGVWNGSMASSTASLDGNNSGYKTFDVKSIVQDWVNGTAEHGLILKQVSSPIVNNELSFYSGASGNPAGTMPYLNVTYIPRPTAVGASPGGPGYTTSLDPTLSATVGSLGAAGSVTFSVSDNTGVLWRDSTASVSAAGVASIPVPDGVLDASRTYTVQVTSSDGTYQSPVASASLTTDLYGAKVPADTCSDDCTTVAATAVVSASGTTAVAPGDTKTFALSVPGVDSDAVTAMFGTISTTGSASGSLYIYDGDYPRPVAPTLLYTNTTAQSSVDLTPSNSDQVTIYNQGSGSVSVEISITQVQTVSDDETDADLNDNVPDDGTGEPAGMDSSQDPQPGDDDGSIGPEDYAALQAVDPAASGLTYSPQGAPAGMSSADAATVESADASAGVTPVSAEARVIGDGTEVTGTGTDPTQNTDSFCSAPVDLNEAEAGEQQLCATPVDETNDEPASTSDTEPGTTAVTPKLVVPEDGSVPYVQAGDTTESVPAADEAAVEAATSAEKVYCPGWKKAWQWDVESRFTACRLETYEFDASSIAIIDETPLWLGYHPVFYARFWVRVDTAANSTYLGYESQMHYIKPAPNQTGVAENFWQQDYCVAACARTDGNTYHQSYTVGPAHQWSPGLFTTFNSQVTGYDLSVHAKVDHQIVWEGDANNSGSAQVVNKYHSARCDDLSYIRASGCVFSDYTPIWYLSGSQYPDTALNVLRGQKIAGSDFVSRTIDDSLARRNARAAMKQCKARGARPDSTYDCDEYPMQHTNEGCYNYPANCYARFIPRSDNRGAGGKLAAFLNSFRVQNNDKYEVEVFYNNP